MFAGQYFDVCCVRLLALETLDGETVEGIASHFQGASICLLASIATVAMDGFSRTTLWTNQMGYITFVAQLPWIYGDVNQPCPRATPSDSVGLLP